MNGDDPERTIYSPSSLPAQEPASVAPSVPSPAAPTAVPATDTPVQSPPPSPVVPQSIKVGDVLNHLYEVRRQIAKGGMGEVFEGSNVNYAEERVAIKVILPHLAADPAIQAMFYKEARTLTRLTHPALVQYRTMAREPQLGVFYIVTEFVDGPNLSDRLRDLGADARQIAALTKRLAEGLAVAHAMGAIHRDISPDNILLEGGTVDGAKIIDFGIAKDLDPTAATIVGDGFAGKLNYVAPEQLGEFGREIGPWTDIYSLGLTILAVARERDVDMGGTIVDAVDKRRAGPDLSPVPDSLRPLIERMVAANPQHRMRSMDEVVHWLANWSLGKAGPEPKPQATVSAADKIAALGGAAKALFRKAQIPPFLKEPRGIAIVGGGALGVLLLFSIGLSFVGGNASDSGPAESTAAAGNPAATVADPVTTTRQVLASGLSQVPCSWLDLGAIDGGNGAPVSVVLKGVSGNMSETVSRVEGMLKKSGVGDLSVNYADIAPVPATICGPLQTIVRYKSAGVAHLSIPQTRFEIAPLDGSWGPAAGKLAAQAVVNLDLSGMTDEVAIIGISKGGDVQLITPNRAGLKPPEWDPQGSDRYRLMVATDEQGWTGVMLVIGKDANSPALFPEQPISMIGAAWAQKFAEQAGQKGWKTEMVWYDVVNSQPDAAPPK